MEHKAIILETFRNRDEHYVDITKTALSVFDKDNPLLVFNERHCEGEKPELSKFKLKKIKFFDNYFVRVFQLIFSFFWYNNNRKIYLSSYPIFNLITIIFSRFQKFETFLLVHGELSVFSKQENKFRQKINKFIQQLVYRYVNNTNNIFICFLDKTITSKIIEILNLKTNKNLISLDWPIDKVDIKKLRNNDLIEIGLFGTHNKKKQSQLINYLESNLPNNKFLFKVVGHNDGIEFNKNIKIVKPKEPNYHVDQSIFFGELSKCDYILSLSNAKDYDMIWSGTVITALKFSVPILTLKNKTFNHYSKLVGSFGYEFENIEKMLAYLSKTNTHELRKSSIDFSKKIYEYDREKFKIGVRNKFKFK